MRFIFIVIFVASLNTVCIGNPLSDEVNKFFSYAKDFNSFSDKYLKENDMNNYSLSTSLFDECMALQEAIYYNGVMLDLLDYSRINNQTLMTQKILVEIQGTLKRLMNNIQFSGKDANHALKFSTDNAFLFRVDKFRTDLENFKARLVSELEKRNY